MISQAATGYGIDPATGHMQPHGQSQVYHDSHHLHHQVRKVYTVIKVFLVSNLRFVQTIVWGMCQVMLECKRLIKQSLINLLLLFTRQEGSMNCLTQ